MANLNLSDLKSQIRRFCGNPTGAPGITSINIEVDDEDIERAINWAVNEVNTKRTGSTEKTTYITTIANQQSYDIPDNVKKVVRIHWEEPFYNSNRLFGDELSMYLIDQVDPLVGFIGDRSSGLINEIHAKEFLNSSIGPKSTVKDGKIYLVPSPTTSGQKVYYDYIEKSPSVTDLDADLYEKPIFYGAAVVVLEQILMARNNKAQIGESALQNVLRINELQILKNELQDKYQLELLKIAQDL